MVAATLDGPSAANRWNDRTHGHTVGAIIAAIMPNHITVSGTRPIGLAACACGIYIAAAAGGLPTVQSNDEKRPCEPLLLNRTTPSSYSASPSAMTCVGA